VGTPVVTLEGPLMRQRMTAGLLRRIDVADTVVTTPEAYVECALEIANNPEKRAQLRDKILANHPALFNNTDAVTCLENFFTEVLSQP
jgi:predicted O-linked N-acetylglucosamine transferase (SPINDLY family)